jgi:hypothetical protein
MVFPYHLSPVYPLWEPDNADFAWYLPFLGALVVGFLVLVNQKRLSPHFKWAMLLYIVFTLPMMGFKNINYFQFAFVADHYFYHGSVGLFLLVGLGAGWLKNRIQPAQLGWRVMTAGVLAVSCVLSVMTWRYCDVWQTPESFWQRTIAINPGCWPAFYNTANARVREYKAIRAVEASEHPDVIRRNRNYVRLMGDINKINDPGREGALLEDAAERYWRVYQINEMITQPIDQLIVVRTLQHKWKEGLKELGQVLLNKPLNQTPRFHETAGDFALRAELPKQAVVHYMNAGRLGMGFGRSMLRNEKFCAAAGQFKAAAQAFTKALTVDRSNQEIAKELTKARERYGSAASRCGGAPVEVDQAESE